MAARYAVARGSSTYTARRESRGGITSKEGFSVVAPMSVSTPSSTLWRRASCCALLNRWISSMKRIVRPPPAPGRGRLLDHGAHFPHTRGDSLELEEFRPGVLRETAQTWSCRFPGDPRDERGKTVLLISKRRGFP